MKDLNNPADFWPEQPNAGPNLNSNLDDACQERRQEYLSAMRGDHPAESASAIDNDDIQWGRKIGHIAASILRRTPCPFHWIDWCNTGLAPGDSIHDRFIGQCRVCGAEHVSELGKYWKKP